MQVIIRQALCVAAIIFANSAAFANDDECDTFFEAASQRDDIIPVELLVDWKSAVGCLVRVIVSESHELPGISEHAAITMVNATGALNTIVEQYDAQAIKEIRLADSEEFVVALSYAARSSSKSLRINATVLLANTVDNTTICIPIDHLYDTENSASDVWQRGRSNLMAVVAVVAPWAYLDNYKNLSSLEAYMRERIRSGKRDYRIEERTDSLSARLAKQDSYENPKKGYSPA